MSEALVLGVAIGFAAFSPPDVDVLVGDTVRWSNTSARAHTVTADDGAFDSGRLGAGATFSQRFDAEGAVPYLCELHPMPGRVTAHRLLLEDPGPGGAPGAERALRARVAVPPGTPVALEADEGAGFRPVAGASAPEHGPVVFSVAPRRSAAFRVTAGAAASPVRRVEVLDRQLRATVLRPGRRAAVRVAAAPATPGGRVVLQLDLPHRFGWWPVARTRLDGASATTLRATVVRRRRARIVLVAPDGATVLATGRPFVLGVRGRPPAARRPGTRGPAAAPHAGHGTG